MASDQYEIPDFSPLREALDAADAARYTPEMQPDAYGFIEAIQNDVDMLREKALASGKPVGRGWLSVMEPFALNARPSIDRLIELESRVAGKKIFGQEDVRFWLHKQHIGDTRSARHWYFSQHPKRKDQQPVDIHYEREPGAIHKLYAGNEHQMSQEEVDRFVEAVQQYAQIVATDVYNTKSKQDYGLAA